MAQLLLLSLGMGAVPAFVGPKDATVRVAFVPTAGDPYEDRTFVERDRKELGELGYDVVDVDLKYQTAESLDAVLADVDLVFVAGGNTFYLLDQVRRSGFGQALEHALDRGVKYVGASAGAIIVGPTTEPVKGLDDPNAAPELASFDGLGIVDFVVLPHYGNEQYLTTYHSISDEFSNRFDVVLLRDDQAILVDDGHRELVVSA